MTMISERLQTIYKKLGITFDPSKLPSQKCAVVTAGFCSGKGECYTHSVLENQAIAGGIDDPELESATKNMVSNATSNGCNILTQN